MLTFLAGMMLVAAASDADPRSPGTARAERPPCPPGSMETCLDTMSRRAAAMLAEDRPQDAERLSRDALRLAVRYRRPLDEATAAGNLAASLRAQGRPAAAARFNRRSVALSVRLLGADSAGTAVAYNNLAVNLDALARYDEAAGLHRRALAIGEAVLGAADPQTALYLDNHAQNLAFQGLYEQARVAHERALAIRRERLGASLPTAVSLTGLAGDLEALGLSERAEPLWREALAMRERLAGTGSPSVGNALHNLAANLIRQGRAADAAPLSARAMAIYAATGATVDRAVVEIGWAKALVDTGRAAAGEAAYREALAVLRARLPAGHPRITDATTGLALVLVGRGDARAALTLLNEVLRLDEATLGRDHPELASSLTLVGRALMERGDIVAARAPLERAVAIARARLPADHPTRILADTALAKLSYATPGGDRVRADALLTEAMAGADARIARRGGFDRAAQRDRRDLAEPFDLRMDANWLVTLQTGRVDPVGRDEAFAAAQRADVTSVATAVAGGGPLADATRRRDALAIARDVADRRETAALGTQGADRSARAARLLAERALATADAELAALDPRRGALDRIAPITLAAVQRLLGADEALLYVRTVADASHVWLVTRDGVRWSREPALARDDLTALIARVRRGVGVADARSQIGAVPPQPFDRSAAQDLYRRLIAPFADAIGDRRRLLFATGGPLAALPLGLLIDGQGRWLAERSAVTALPGPGALATWRCAARPDCRSPARPASAIDLLAVSDTAAATGATRQDWRAALPTIAAAEVQAVVPLFAPRARRIAADEAGFRADPDLGTARYLLLAMHGLAAGPGGEPGLVFAPPVAGADTDGFLAASEAASLRLSADLVVLSACDTAGADGTPDGEAFSGLVRGFLIGGARSVLASQWRVGDAATAALVTALFRRLRDGAMPADALQAAMADVRDTPGGRWADPRYWAGFTLVGDGR